MSTSRSQSCADWALSEFGGTILGDRRRTRRLVAMASQVAQTPGAHLTRVFRTGSDRQAAYKLLEHGHLSPEALLDSSSRAAFAKASGPFVVASLDLCTLSLPAASRASGFGRIGRRPSSCGAESLHAVLLDAAGTPLGLAAQHLWVRTQPPRPPGTVTRGLPLEQKETRFWLEVGERLLQAAETAGYSGTVWAQCDAGAEAREVLEWAAWQPKLEITVRCRRPHHALWPHDRDLWDLMRTQPVLGRYDLEVRKGPQRQRRRALLEVRARPVVLQLRNPQTSEKTAVGLYAVYVRERGTCPGGEEPIEWLLVTTHPVESLQSAREVVRLYALRWRVEEVHRSWKEGACEVERSGLSWEAFRSWAVVLLCVAVRIERLKRLSREQPEASARSEFSETELRALVLLRHERKATDEELAQLNLGQAVLWLAQLGGYTGPSPSRGPPGSATLSRGLESLLQAVHVLEISARQK
jgi:hypothetical protein